MSEFEQDLRVAVAECGRLFECAKDTWMKYFKFDISDVDWLKKSDARYGVMKTAVLLWEIMKDRSWAKRLKFDIDRLAFDREKLAFSSR